MMYLISQLWIWLLLALIVGLFVGWKTCSQEPTRWWGGWVPWGVFLFLGGLLLAIGRILPNFMGFLLDSALLMFATYILGCCIACLIKQWRERGHGSGHAAAVAGLGSAGLGAGHGRLATGAGQSSAASAKAAADHSGLSLKAGDTGAISAATKLDSQAGGSGSGSATADNMDAGKQGASPSMASAAGADNAAGAGNDISADASTTSSATPALLAASGNEASGHKADVAADEGDTAEALPPQPDIAVPDGLTGSRPRGYVTPLNGTPDDLKRIKGIGRQNEGRLHALGIWHFQQIADWVQSEVDWVGGFLAFPGRIEREEWVKQAKILAKGGTTKFSKRAGRGRVESSRDTGDKGQSNVADLSELMKTAPKKKPD